MEYTNIHLRFNLANGDVCIARLSEDVNWNQTGIVLTVYYDGELYDAWCKEENIMPKKDWCLTKREVEDGVYENLVKDFLFTGENVIDITSPVLD